MITKEEMEKINIALRKSKNVAIIWNVVVLGLGVFFTYYLFQFFPQLLPTMGILTALSLVFISLYGFLLNTHAKISIFSKDEGLEISKSKKGLFNMIKYEWIELVILNEMGGGGLYIDIFFTKDGGKYIYRDFQTRIEDYKKFVETLREKGVEVRILEPSLKYQKKHDFGWIGDMMRGREWMR